MQSPSRSLRITPLTAFFDIPSTLRRWKKITSDNLHVGFFNLFLPGLPFQTQYVRAWFPSVEVSPSYTSSETFSSCVVMRNIFVFKWNIDSRLEPSHSFPSHWYDFLHDQWSLAPLFFSSGQWTVNEKEWGLIFISFISFHAKWQEKEIILLSGRSAGRRASFRSGNSNCNLHPMWCWKRMGKRGKMEQVLTLGLVLHEWTGRKTKSCSLILAKKEKKRESRESQHAEAAPPKGGKNESDTSCSFSPIPFIVLICCCYFISPLMHDLMRKKVQWLRSWLHGTEGAEPRT